jgi:hypothetical protein
VAQKSEAGGGLTAAFSFIPHFPQGVIAEMVQRRVPLVGSGAKWRITNLREVAQAMAVWG